MNKLLKTLLLALALVLVLVGAYVLYNKLRANLPNSSIVVTEQAGTLEDSAAAPAEEEAEPQNTVDPQDGQADAEGEEPILAPDFTVQNDQGEAVMLSDLRGTPVVLNFWASWCPPCKSEMPDFQAAATEYEGQVAFMMVNLTDGSRETVDTAKAYIQEQGFTFPVYFDTQSEAANAYGVMSIPTTFFIDAQGYMVAYGQGALDAETLARGIGMLLPAE